MTIDTNTEPTPVDVVQNRIVESFTSLCGDPDNATVAEDVDSALHSLDGLLAREVSRIGPEERIGSELAR